MLANYESSIVHPQKKKIKMYILYILPKILKCELILPSGYRLGAGATRG